MDALPHLPGVVTAEVIFHCLFVVHFGLLDTPPQLGASSTIKSSVLSTILKCSRNFIKLYVVEAVSSELIVAKFVTLIGLEHWFMCQPLNLPLTEKIEKLQVKIASIGLGGIVLDDVISRFKGNFFSSHQ